MEKIRVLVVDDSLVVRRVVTEELAAQAGHRSRRLGGQRADRARKDGRSCNPDLVILDIEMPEMDGLTALTPSARASPQNPGDHVQLAHRAGSGGHAGSAVTRGLRFLRQAGRSGRTGGIATGHPQRTDSRDPRPAPSQGECSRRARAYKTASAASNLRSLSHRPGRDRRFDRRSERPGRAVRRSASRFPGADPRRAAHAADVHANAGGAADEELEDPNRGSEIRHGTGARQGVDRPGRSPPRRRSRRSSRRGPKCIKTRPKTPAALRSIRCSGRSRAFTGATAWRSC